MTAQQYHDIVIEKIIEFKNQTGQQPTHIYLGATVYNILFDGIGLRSVQKPEFIKGTYCGLKYIVTCTNPEHIGIGYGGDAK